MSLALTEIARQAVIDHPRSVIEVAISFCAKSEKCFGFVGESNDRLLKVGRSITSALELFPPEDVRLEQSLQLIEKECEALLSIRSGTFKMPTVQFGATRINMPIVTLGCMRFQQEWGSRVNCMDLVSSDCQDNLVSLLKYAIGTLGMTHIETARGYGSSELQLGVALKQLFMTNFCQRSDLIIQTKVSPMKNASDFRKTFETSLKNLQLDYVDLFAFHGFNLEEQWDFVFGEPFADNTQNCYQVVQEYIALGKIRHLGFSTHGPVNLIMNLINTNVFEYVNLHYHYFGSYTATGGGQDGAGNLDCIKLLTEKNMGIFIISPFDKGGRLYAPSRTLRSLTLPDVEPISFMSYWIWNHHKVVPNVTWNNSNAKNDSVTPKLLQIHTYTVGAGRPSDLDQPAVAAYLHMTQNDTIMATLQTVTNRLRDRKLEALGREWVENWWKGLPKSFSCPNVVEHNQIVWMYNSIRAFGMYEFAKARYASCENNYYGKWNERMNTYDNIHTNVGVGGWGYVPGLPLLPFNYSLDFVKDYSTDLINVPPANRKRVVEAELFVYTWCRNLARDPNTSKKKKNISREDDTSTMSPNEEAETTLTNPLGNHRPFYGTTFLSKEEYEEINDIITKEEQKQQSKSIDSRTCNGINVPIGWDTSYDMRPWPDFPDRVRRS